MPLHCGKMMSNMRKLFTTAHFTIQTFKNLNVQLFQIYPTRPATSYSYIVLGCHILESVVAEHRIFYKQLTFLSILKLLIFHEKMILQLLNFIPFLSKMSRFVTYLSPKNTKKSVLGLLNFREKLITVAYEGVAYKKSCSYIPDSGAY